MAKINKEYIAEKGKSMKKRTKWTIAGAGVTAASIAAGVAAAVSRSISKFVVDAALNREEPRQMKGGKSPHNAVIPEELTKELQRLSQKLKESDCETVTISARDGERLVGHWHYREGDKRILIAMHGWRSSWTHDFGAIADFWQDNGCSVLYAEQRGQGESGGEHMGFGMIERYDCLDWINWVNEKTEGKMPIYLAGISMGASTVLMTGGFDLPENVCGIMADCGFTSAHAIWKYVVEGNTRFSYDSRSKAVDDLCKKKINVGTQEYTTLDAMKECKVPVLLVHGTEDSFVPVEMTYENYKACNAPKRLFIVPGATHAMSYMVDRDGYEKTVREFWEEFDC